VQRAKEGTSAASHSMNTQIYPILTKSTIDNYWGQSSGFAECRLTVVQGNPLPTQPASGNTVYLEPYNGSRLSLKDKIEDQWRVFTLQSGIPVSVTIPQSGAAHVFAYYNSVSDNIELEAVPWLDYNTPSGEMSRENGVLVRPDETWKRYVGDFYAATNQMVWDTPTRKHLYNVQNREKRNLYVNIPDNSWIISSNVGVRHLNGIQRSVSIFVGQSGVSELDLEASLSVYSTETSSSTQYIIGLSHNV